MSPTRVSRFVFILLPIFVTVTYADEIARVSSSVCPPKSIKDSIFSSQSPVCPLNDSFGVIEGDEASLQKALNLVNENAKSYVVVLFYAYWCPFSVTFRPTLSVMASLYPSISHFAIEESVIRPSILSKYGVHGFPTLIVLNSTMRVRYMGLGLLILLWIFTLTLQVSGDETGIKRDSINETSLRETVHEQEKGNINAPENCPFSWAQSPINMLQHETYLTLATIFVVLRLVFLSYPFIMTCARVSWRRRNLNIPVGTPFIVHESCNSIIHFTHRALQKKQSAWSHECQS